MAPGQPPPGGPYPGQGQPTQPPGRSSKVGWIIGGAAVLGALVLILGLVGITFLGRSDEGSDGAATTTRVGSSPTFGPTTTSSSTGEAETVFTDDFDDPGSGWTTMALPSGTTFDYVGGNYVTVAKGTLHHFAKTPYTEPLAGIRARVTATQTPGAQAGSGFGVTCRTGPDSAVVRYQFLLATPNRWFVERQAGPNATAKAVLLKQGSTMTSPGKAPVTVEGTCHTAQGSTTTHLTMRIDGKQVASLDDDTGREVGGWLSELLVTSRAESPVTVTASSFEVARTS